MTLEEAQKIFSPGFLSQITAVSINGNFGDIVMNPQADQIITYFRQHNPTMDIVIDTNGGGRSENFWKHLAEMKCIVRFAIDGLEDTNHLYRQNVSWDKVMKSAQTFISAGGRAIWKYVPFEHNQHQIEKIYQTAESMGFDHVQQDQQNRNQAPVFNKHGKLIHVMGNVKDVDFGKILHHRRTADVLLEDIINDRKPVPIDCYVKKKRSVYVSSVGRVYPCCRVGFHPESYGKGNYFQAANAQIRNHLDKNNALEHDLEICIQWFNSLEKAWSSPSFEEGRPIICHDVCGQRNKDQ